MASQLSAATKWQTSPDIFKICYGYKSQIKLV